MKSAHGYIILFVSFFGIIFLQNYVDDKNGGPLNTIGMLKNINQTIRFENKINELEFTIDSLTTLISDRVETKAEVLKTSTSLLISKNNKIETEYFFTDLDEAVRIRNEKGDLSSLAQKYINIAFELGGEDWYGAEKIWDTDIFRDRLRSLNLDQ
tara:strand:+ start:154 stop:618 length:465 start_codon:yes stop_codon:yes gene_type:complete